MAEGCRLSWRGGAGVRFGSPDGLARPPRSESGLQVSSVTACTAVMAANGKPVGGQRLQCQVSALRSTGRCSTTRKRLVLQRMRYSISVAATRCMKACDASSATGFAGGCALQRSDQHPAAESPQSAPISGGCVHA
jgi:hypothetical protein